MGPEALQKIFGRLAPIPSEEWAAAAAFLRPLTVSEKGVLIRQGDPVREILFVERGLLKTFFTDEDGDETTKGFVSEGELACPYVSLLTGQPANFGIVALEDSQILALAAGALPALYSRHACWQQVGRKVAEKLLIEREWREYLLLMKNASERYEAFLKRFPALSERIPLYEIASFLGMTPVALSQVRAKRK